MLLESDKRTCQGAKWQERKADACPGRSWTRIWSDVANGLEGQDAGGEACGRSGAGDTGEAAQVGAGNECAVGTFHFFLLMRKFRTGFWGFFWKRGVGGVWGQGEEGEY